MLTLLSPATLVGLGLSVDTLRVPLVPVFELNDVNSPEQEKHAPLDSFLVF